MEFILPKIALSEDPHVRREFLDAYFPSGIIPFEISGQNGWNLFCFEPEEPEFYVDPQLDRVARNWLGIKISDLDCYYCFEKNALFSLFDSWSIYYWSLVVQWLRRERIVYKKCAVLHVDDHLDFAAPHLSVEGDTYCSLFSQKQISVQNPESIAVAIREKSIGIGSFFAPFIHALGQCDIFHWRCSEKGVKKQMLFSPSYENDTLLSPQSKRPSISLGVEQGNCKYVVSREIDDHIDSLYEYDLIFLHIDCDAFSNRYNLNSHWDRDLPNIDLPLESIKTKISDFINKIAPLPAAKYMNVAFSPGFFPAEHWEVVYDWIFMEAKQKGIVREDAFSEFLASHSGKKEIVSHNLSAECNLKV